MRTTLEEATTNAANAALRTQEQQMREVLNDVVPGWTLERLKGRLQLVRHAGSPVEILTLDGYPLLEIWPVEWDLVREGESWKYRGTQKFRRL
jgi:hypothetical protein